MYHSYSNIEVQSKLLDDILKLLEEICQEVYFLD